MNRQEQFRYSFIIAKIKFQIDNEFPQMVRDVKTEDDVTIFYFSNRKKYYSVKFQSLLLNINLTILWPEGIDNVIFVYDSKNENRDNFHIRIKNDLAIIENNWKIKKEKGFLVKGSQIFEKEGSDLSLEVA